MFLVGEALIGKEPEIAHIDLIIGDKEGPVATAFASGLTQLSAGHTPLLGVIRPNLPPKPSTLIVPKVTVKNMDQAAQIFGPAQMAVAKAVADVVAEGVIPKDKVEELVVIVSVFIHPQAKDYDAIYRYNYGATKLALQRAMAGFPDIDKVLYEKDRSTHPIMGFRVTRLWDPPYLQVAFDLVDVAEVRRVLTALPESDHILIEVGTPLVKMLGINVVKEIGPSGPERSSSWISRPWIRATWRCGWLQTPLPTPWSSPAWLPRRPWSCPSRGQKDGHLLHHRYAQCAGPAGGLEGPGCPARCGRAASRHR